MGVLRSTATKSSAWASVSWLVFLPRMTSTSAMRSTGEKKCKPMKLAGRLDASAKPVIGRVDVFEA